MKDCLCSKSSVQHHYWWMCSSCDSTQEEQEKLHLTCLCCSFLYGSGAAIAGPVTEPHQQSCSKDQLIWAKFKKAKYWQNWTEGSHLPDMLCWDQPSTSFSVSLQKKIKIIESLNNSWEPQWFTEVSNTDLIVMGNWSKETYQPCILLKDSPKELILKIYRSSCIYWNIRMVLSSSCYWHSFMLFSMTVVLVKQFWSSWWWNQQQRRLSLCSLSLRNSTQTNYLNTS